MSAPVLAGIGKIQKQTTELEKKINQLDTSLKEPYAIGSLNLFPGHSPVNFIDSNGFEFLKTGYVKEWDSTYSRFVYRKVINVDRISNTNGNDFAESFHFISDGTYVGGIADNSNDRFYIHGFPNIQDLTVRVSGGYSTFGLSSGKSGAFLSDDGTIAMFFIGRTLYKFNLSTPFDPTTFSSDGSVNLDTISDGYFVTPAGGSRITRDGKYLFVFSTGSQSESYNHIAKYEFLTPYDVNSLVKVNEFYLIGAMPDGVSTNLLRGIEVTHDPFPIILFQIGGAGVSNGLYEIFFEDSTFETPLVRKRASVTSIDVVQKIGLRSDYLIVFSTLTNAIQYSFSGGIYADSINASDGTYELEYMRIK